MPLLKIKNEEEKAMTMKEIIKSYCDEPETKVLILLEHEEQVKNGLEWIEEIKGQKQVIALSPFAMYELDRQNVPYHIPEDYYEPQELYQLGIANYKKVEEICILIDGEIQKACPIMEKLGIKPALFSFFYLKILYDAATIRLFQLFKLIDTEKPDVILIHGSEKYPFGISKNAPYLLFDNRESIYAHLLALDEWKVPVKMLPYIPQPENAYAQGEKYQTIVNRLKKEAVGWLQTHPKLFDLALKTQRGEWYGLFSGLKSDLHANKNMPVLLFGSGYNWDIARDDLLSAGIGPIIKMQDDLNYWTSEPFLDKVDSDAILNVCEELKADDKLRKFFIFEGIDFSPMIEERLRFLMEHLTSACLNAYNELKELLKNKEIRAVLTSFFPTCVSHSIAQAARDASVPIIDWHHGSYGYTNQPMIIYQDIMSADVKFDFGEGVVKRYAEPAKRFNTELVPVGSATLDGFNRKIRPTRSKKFIRLESKKKVVLYVTTNFYQNNLYVSFPPPFSDRYFWTTQKSIVDILAKHDNYVAIIKTHPSLMYRESPMRVYAEEKGFENCQFIRGECGFTDLLPLADIIVIDFPATTLLQSLTTSKPIFAYTGHLHIDDAPLRLLKRRAYCYSGLEKFTKTLDTFLSSGSIDTQVDLKDRAFLKMYGTHLDDGKSGVRAANVLINIINESKLDR